MSLRSPRHKGPRASERIAELRRRLLLMGGRVEEMVAHATKSLVEGDAVLARACIEADAAINRDEMEIDGLCLDLLADGVPEEVDLRFITLALKMVVDLERIGDLAVNICERALDLSTRPKLMPWIDIPRMADHVQAMVRDAIDALVAGDADKARALIARDDAVDLLYTQVFKEVLALMIEDPDAVERGIHVQSVAKWLERMADHSTNLAEQVIFLVEGQDARHRFSVGANHADGPLFKA